jgi:hypothetical protein
LHAPDAADAAKPALAGLAPGRITHKKGFSSTTFFFSK